MLLFLGRVCCTGFEGRVSEKGSPTRAQEGRAWVKQVQQPVLELPCFLQGGGQPTPLFQDRCLYECCLSATCSEKRLSFALCAPDVLQILVFTLSAPRGVCLPSLQEEGSALLALSQPCSLTFTTQHFQPCQLQELTKFKPAHFPNHWP